MSSFGSLMSRNLIGVMLAAALLLFQVLAMEPQQERTEENLGACLMGLPSEIVLEIFDLIDDPEAMFRFAMSCHKTRNLLEWKLLANCLFHYKTPIHAIPHLIRSFCNYLDENPDSQPIAASLEPQQIARLFNRLSGVTHYSDLSGVKGPPRHVQIPDAIFEEKEVEDMVISLIKAVNRPEITGLATILLTSERCLTGLAARLDPFPMPTNIPEPIMKYIESEEAKVLSGSAPTYQVSDIRAMWPIPTGVPASFVNNIESKEAESLVSSIRDQFPFRVFPNSCAIAYCIAADPNLLVWLSESTLLALLSVGIQFDIRILSIVRFAPETLPAIFPLLGYKSYAFNVMKQYLDYGDDDVVLALMRTVDFRELIFNDPLNFVTFASHMVRSPNIEMIRVLVQEQFLDDFLNAPIYNFGLLLTRALENVERVEIAKLLLTVPNVDLYRPNPAPKYFPLHSNMQFLFGRVIRKEVAHQILISSEFQNLIRRHPAAFRHFLKEEEGRLEFLESLCSDFASEIMQGQ